MDTIKKIFGIMLAFALFTINAVAQDKAAEGAKAVTANMKEQLSLNDSQYTKVYAINQDFLKKAMENKTTAKTRIEKAKRLKALDEERDAKLKSVLTEEQFKIFVANKAENRKKIRQYFQEKAEEQGM
ncbi:hypothetical protein [Flavobacterium cyanobacteriorum]|nr:hypothetical protein [Flavobacterium cyanobacteriorum]